MGFCREGNYPGDEEEQKVKITKLEKAQELLKIMLSTQDIPEKDVLGRMEISERTVRSGAKNVGVTAYRKNKIWYWSIQKSRQG